VLQPENYCRELESYLCKKNDGHLVRIVGPGFERVSDWARQGIPISVACAGIDAYFERYYRRGPRRRPVRIEFCEADVLDAFDAWRRAVGVARADDTQPRARVSLASHIERAIARLTTLRASSQRAHVVADAIERVTRELDGLLGAARSARGHAREGLIETLATLDRELVDAVLTALPEEGRQRALHDADEQLAPFRDRMTPDAFARARTAAAEQQVREQFGLPPVAFE
jgi:hypothetical protein